MNATEHKFIDQRKVLRLVCYRAHKFGKKIKEVCPFQFLEIDERCKNCVWFKILDESKKVSEFFREIEISGTRKLIMDENELKALPLSEEELTGLKVRDK